MQKFKNAFFSFLDNQKKRIPMVIALSILSFGFIVAAITSTNTVSISDGEKTFTVRTISSDIASIVRNTKFGSSDYKILSTCISGKQVDVSVVKTFPVYITVGNQTKKVFTAGGTVKDILENSGYQVDKYDMVQPSLDTYVDGETYIDYTDIDYVEGKKTQQISHKIRTTYTARYVEGTKKTLKKGSNGVSEISFVKKVVNGEVVKTKITSKKTVKKPVTAEKIVGTGKKGKGVISTTSGKIKTISQLSPKKEIALDSEGNPVDYAKKMTVEATAYTYTGHRCSTGVVPKPGYIAVNPKVIPYGTKLYIKSKDGRFVYGYAIAADTGGFIYSRPNNVDLFMSTESQCSSFGRRNVEIYVLG